MWHIGIFAAQDDAIFLALEYLERLGLVVGRDDYFEEYFVDFSGGGFVDYGVGDNHSAEGRHGVAGEGIFPCLDGCGACSQAAGIVVFEHGESGFGAEFVDEVYGGVDVKQVVVGDFFAVELVEEGVEMAEEVSALVGVFAVAE